jgi:hypothetical protein
VYAAALVVLAGGRVSCAQSQQDAWLMKNYRFTGPPAPGTVPPADPVLSELWRIQDNIHWMLWRAKQDEDYWTALAAAAQMTTNVTAIGAVTEHREAVAAAKALVAQAAAQAKANTPPPLYLIAFRDHSIAAATKYWTEGPILHYLTPEGAHVQTRLELVDRSLSARLNQEAHLEFRLPE